MGSGSVQPLDVRGWDAWWTWTWLPVPRLEVDKGCTRKRYPGWGRAGAKGAQH